MISSYFTGIRIPTELTQREAGLVGEALTSVSPTIVYRVCMFNQKPLDLDHTLQEANHYLRLLKIFERQFSSHAKFE